jgi:fatty-acyl-CoA synthase
MSFLTETKLNLRRVRSAGKALRLKADDVLSPALLVAEQAKKIGQKVCLRFEDQQITYAELDRQVTRYAQAAAALGLGKGDIAAVMMENRPEFLYTLFGLNRLGITAALINTNLVGTPLTHVFAAANMKALFVGAECLPAIEEVLTELAIPRDRILVERTEEPNRVMPTDARDLTVLADQSPDALAGLALNPAKGGEYLVYIYTSGTTGLPKAGRVPNMRWFGGGYGIGGLATACGHDDVVYVCLPLYHSSAFMLGISFGLLHGGQVALARKFSATRFWDDIRKYEATVFVYIGEVCRYLVSQPATANDKLHKVRAISGNGMRPDVWREFVSRFGIEKVHEFYAATEGNANMFNLNGHVGAVGQLNMITKLAYNIALVKWDPITEEPIRNAQGFCIPCDVDEPGELLGKIDPAKVNTRFDGYTDPKATEKKILRNVFEKGDEYFRTGDLLRKDAEGYFYFVDRIGDTFRWKGENVATNEVADVLTAHPQIEVANVYGVEIAGADGRAGMASLNTTDSVEPDWKSIYEHTAKNLPAYARPVFLRWQKEASLTVTFKLRKVDLQNDGFDPERSPDPIFYRDSEAGTYVPVDKALFARLNNGEVRV